jgi:Ferritin-like domain
LTGFAAGEPASQSPPGRLAGPSSRRGLLCGAGAGLAGLLVAGCGGKQSLKAQVHNSAPVLGTDVDLLNQLLDLEHKAIAAYTAGIPLLSPATVKAGQLFLNDELYHAGSLAGWVKAAGGMPIMPAPSYDLGHPQTSHEVLALLHEIEQAQITAYLAALPRLAPSEVQQSVASILANDAQHVAVVRYTLGQTAVPSAFVTGRE